MGLLPAARAASRRRGNGSRRWPGPGSGTSILNHEARSVKFRVRGAGDEPRRGRQRLRARPRGGTAPRRSGACARAPLHGGGSSVYAIGRPPGEPARLAGALEAPDRPGRSLGTVHLRDRGLGTSAATFQYFEYKGRETRAPARPAHRLAGARHRQRQRDRPDRGRGRRDVHRRVRAGREAGAERLTRLSPTLGAVVLPRRPSERRPRDLQSRARIRTLLPDTTADHADRPMTHSPASRSGALRRPRRDRAGADRRHRQNRWSLRVFFLLALRLAIGWHFLFEGLYKVHSHYGRPDRDEPARSRASRTSKSRPAPSATFMRKQFARPGPRSSREGEAGRRRSHPQAFDKLTVAEQAAECPAAVATRARRTASRTPRRRSRRRPTKDLAKADADEAKAHQGGQDRRGQGRRRRQAAEKARTAARQEGREAPRANCAEERIIDGEGGVRPVGVRRADAPRPGRVCERSIPRPATCSLTAPQRLEHLEWLRGEAKIAEERRAAGLGNGIGIEQKRAAEVRTDLHRRRVRPRPGRGRCSSRS